MAHTFPQRPPFARPGSQFAPTVPDPFDVAARRFERSGAELYLNDPIGFARNAIRWGTPKDNAPPGYEPGLTPYQQDILHRLVTNRRVAVRGPHGLGKSTTAATLILWFAITREAARLDWKCVTTAGSWHQLEHYLWPEVHKWAARVDWGHLEMQPWRPDRELLSLNLKLRHGSAFAAASTRVELIEGAHADHLLFIFDESKAIKPETFDAAEGALSGADAYAAMFSTPGEPQGRFFDVHQHKAGYEDWSVRHVNKTEVIEAKRMDAVWAQNRLAQWGATSPVYNNRVLGEFWLSDEEAVISIPWVEAANERWVEWDKAGRPNHPGIDIFGVDVARGGGDLTAVAHRLGPIVREIRTWNLHDTTKVAYRVKRKMANQTALAVIDVVGVGAGVVDLLRRWKLNVIAFSAGRTTKRRDRSGLLGFTNQRSAMWWMLREALDPAFDPTLALPPNDDLLGELTAPKWRQAGTEGKIEVESKKDIRKRLGRSTDLADAVGHTLLTDAEFNTIEPTNALVYPFSDSDAGEDEGIFRWGKNPNDDYRSSRGGGEDSSY